jgi:hypothetical protein
MWGLGPVDAGDDEESSGAGEPSDADERVLLWAPGGAEVRGRELETLSGANPTAGRRRGSRCPPSP